MSEVLRFRMTYTHCGTTWTDDWSCTCNSECPICRHDIEPIEVVDLTEPPARSYPPMSYVLITIQGGVVQDIVTTIPEIGLTAIIVDHDSDQYDESHEGRMLSPSGDEVVVIEKPIRHAPKIISKYIGKGVRE